MSKALSTLLIANRGEIARRVIRTAQALGIKTVAVYSDIDAGARHVAEADTAIALGGTKPADSYLLIDKIIAAAKASGADAVHPGYGFLSENASFARRLEAEGIVFLGPPASAIDAMGSKSAAKTLMEAAGVPLVPGYHGAEQDLETFQRASERIGYPVLLKAAAGGGGKGMKVVDNPGDLAEALGSAKREARAAFGDEQMLVEKYVIGPRHVEIQVFADQHGHCLYLHERDCSIQRRHQKVVEEAPAPGLAPELRRAMGEAAVKAAQAIGYVGAGTVEFLLDARGDFFFMEMNTRLQVEHPVTEAITGLDLVAWQVRVARGEPLPLAQAEVPLRGHAMEVRVYAEDPEGGFLPASGRLDLYVEATAGEGRRVDSGVVQGDTISPFYDPMIAKVIAWGDTREDARRRLLAMLGQTAIGGLKTNLGFLKRIMASPEFAAAQLDTGFIERHADALLVPTPEPSEAFWDFAAQAYLATYAALAPGTDSQSPWNLRSGWRGPAQAAAVLHLGAGPHSRLCTFSPVAPQARQGKVLGRRGDVLYLEWEGHTYDVSAIDPLADVPGSHAVEGGLAAPMNGSIVRILVAPGQRVQPGDALIVVEAMKMEHTLRAAKAGRVAAVFCSEGELVAEGTPLAELEEVADDAA